METISKALYEAPMTQVLDLVTEGVVCLSGGEYPGWDQEVI